MNNSLIKSRKLVKKKDKNGIKNKKYKTITGNKTKRRVQNNGSTYDKEDYDSGEGFLTSIWGSALWHSLHTISFNYPVNPTADDKENYMNFILNLQNVLPCKYCRINLVKNFKELPLTLKTMENRDSFSRYMYNLHELINKMLGKKSNLTFDDVRERYEHFRARGCDKTLNSKTRKLKHKGCTIPLYGKKAKCVIKIVPQDKKCETFQMDKQCIKTRRNK